MGKVNQGQLRIDALLTSGVAIYTGACDKTGHPLVSFPSFAHAEFLERSESDILTLLSYFRSIIPPNHTSSSFVYVINLKTANQNVVEKIFRVLLELQNKNPVISVHSLYVIKPQAIKPFKLLEKLAGLRKSKKVQSYCTFQVQISADFAALHRVIDKKYLLEEFGGHLKVDVVGYAQFRQGVDQLKRDIGATKSNLNKAKDRMYILCDLELPDEAGDISKRLESMNDEYTSLMSEVNLEDLIDRCSAMTSDLSDKNASRYAQGDMLRSLIITVQDDQKMLNDARELLEMLWRKAQARFIQALQLKNHHKKATKITKWVRRIGTERLERISEPITDELQVQSANQKLEELNVDLQQIEEEMEYINTDVEYMAIQDTSEISDSLKSIDRAQNDLQAFEKKLAEKRDRLNIIESVLINLTKCYKWYSNYLMSLSICDNPDRFQLNCQEQLAKLKDSAPPAEWLDYIGDKILLTEDPLTISNASTLIFRIRKMMAVDVDNELAMMIPDVKLWKKNLDDGLRGVNSHLIINNKNDSFDAGTGEMGHEGNRYHSKPYSHAPKLHTASHIPKLHGNANSSIATVHEDNIDPRLSNDICRPDSTQGVKESYIDLSRSREDIELPESLSHLDLTDFLRNEPNAQRGRKSRKKAEDKMKIKSSKSELLHPPRQDMEDDDIDDSCPQLHTTVSMQSNRTGCCDESTDTPILHEYSSPPSTKYKTRKYRTRLDEIVTGNRSAEEKLDMMAALINEESTNQFASVHHLPFCDVASNPTNRGDNDDITDTDILNESRRSSHGVGLSEHVYHWLSRQDNFIISKPNLNESQDSLDSVKECINRAERIIEEGLPDFPRASTNTINNDQVSKSGDSGITEITISNLQQLSNRLSVSKESGLESDLSSGMNHKTNNHRPHGALHKYST